MQTYEDLINDALEIVSAWDIPDELLADTVVAQAKLMAGISPEEILKDLQETH